MLAKRTGFERLYGRINLFSRSKSGNREISWFFYLRFRWALCRYRGRERFFQLFLMHDLRSTYACWWHLGHQRGLGNSSGIWTSESCNLRSHLSWWFKLFLAQIRHSPAKPFPTHLPPIHHLLQLRLANVTEIKRSARHNHRLSCIFDSRPIPHYRMPSFFKGFLIIKRTLPLISSTGGHSQKQFSRFLWR